MPLIIYSARTGRIRATVYDEKGVLTDDELAVHHLPGPGEEVFLTQVTEAQVWGMSQSEFSVEMNLFPKDDRYVGLDRDGVVAGILETGDPDCGDSIQDLTLVADNVARVGWRQMRNLTWQRSLAEIDHEIATLDAQKARLTDGLTQEQVDLRIGTVQTQLDVLAAERMMRVAVR